MPKLNEHDIHQVALPVRSACFVLLLCPCSHGQVLHRHRNKPGQILCDACTDQFNSQHMVQMEWVIDTHGSMEIEQRTIWFDIRLIICQRGDGTLSIRAFPPELPVIYLNPNEPYAATEVLISDPRSGVAQHDVFFRLLIDAFPPSCCCCFCRTLGRLR